MRMSQQLSLPHNFSYSEFYYIQIEKFARQAIAEGVQEADEITIVTESELIRTLNTHYNRNNQIPVRILPKIFNSTVHLPSARY